MQNETIYTINIPTNDSNIPEVNIRISKYKNKKRPLKISTFKHDTNNKLQIT
jgi:hypothetical protein